jgi:hypothetical protein
MKTKPFVLSLSKQERRSDAPFDKLRVNGDGPSEEHRGPRRFSEKLIFSIPDSLVAHRRTDPGYLAQRYRGEEAAGVGRQLKGGENFPIMVAKFFRRLYSRRKKGLRQIPSKRIYPHKEKFNLLPCR